MTHCNKSSLKEKKQHFLYSDQIFIFTSYPAESPIRTDFTRLLEWATTIRKTGTTLNTDDVWRTLSYNSRRRKGNSWETRTQQLIHSTRDCIFQRQVILDFVVSSSGASCVNRLQNWKLMSTRLQQVVDFNLYKAGIE